MVTTLLIGASLQSKFHFVFCNLLFLLSIFHFFVDEPAAVLHPLIVEGTKETLIDDRPLEGLGEIGLRPNCPVLSFPLRDC